MERMLRISVTYREAQRIYYRILSDNIIVLAVTHKKDSVKLLEKLR